MGEKADLKRSRRAYRLKLSDLESELAADEESRRAAPEAVQPTWDQIVATRRITIAQLEKYIADIEECLIALKQRPESSDVTSP